jgi:hypothetical protein
MKIRVSSDKMKELQKLWQQWHHSLHSTEITVLTEAGEDVRNGTKDFNVDDRLPAYLTSVNFTYQEVRHPNPELLS